MSETAAIFTVLGALALVAVCSVALWKYGATRRDRDELSLILRQLLDTSPDLIALIDPATGELHDVNEPFCHATGYTRGELIGMNSYEIGLWADPTRLELIRERLQAGKPARSERVSCRTKSGEMRTLRVSAEQITCGGKPCLITLATDVTEQERMERDLLKSKQQYQELVDTLPLVIFEMDLTGRITYANRTTHTIFRYPDETFWKSMNAFQMILPADRERAFANLYKRLSGLIFDVQEYAAVRSDGTAFPILLHSNIIMRDGKAEGMRGFLIDITERKNAEAALCASEDKFRRLFEESRDVIFFSTPEGVILDINQAGLKLFQYTTKEELVGRDLCKELFADKSAWDLCYRRLSQEGFIKDFEVLFRRRDGEIMTVLITASGVFGEGGAMTAVRGIMRDITGHKMLEAQLMQAQKMEAVGQLAGGIAHDFNNILTTIIGYSDLIRKRISGDATSDRYLHELVAAAERAAELTQRLLAFSRKQVLTMRPIDLNEVARKVENLLAPAIGEDIELSLSLDERELMIMADSVQIEQVLMNLAMNARDAMPEGGSLTISTSLAEVDASTASPAEEVKPGSYAAISVNDTGTGMDENTILHVFEPFFTTKDVGKGTGLGLAMVYGIIQQHEGTIRVESAPEKGATFTVFLPLLASSPKGRHAPPGPADTALETTHHGSGTILVAEDNDQVRMLSRIILERAGYTVIVAADGEEALRRFGEHADAIRLVVLDLVMPRMNGKQVFEAIRRIKPDIKALLTSGYSADTAHQKGIMDEQGPALLHKPISPRELLKRVHQELER